MNPFPKALCSTGICQILCFSIHTFFLLFVCFPISLPTGLMPVSSSSSSCCFCRCNSSYLLCVVLSAQQVSSSARRCMVFRWRLQPFLSFPILRHILQNTCRLFVFVFFFIFYYCSLIFFFFFFFLSFFFSSLMVWLVFLCSRTWYASTLLALP